MTNKIIGLVVNEMSVNDYKIFYIDKFKDSDREFMLIDLSSIIFSKSLNEEFCDKSVSNLSELKEVLEKNKYFFLYFDNNISIRPILDLMFNYKDKFYFQISNDSILLSYTNARKINLRFIYYNLIRYIKNKNLMKMIYHRKITKKLKTIQFTPTAKEISLRIPSYIYDMYSEQKTKLDSTNNKYHLFIDQNLPYHRDYSFHKVFKNTERYFKELRNFFDFLELKTNKPVKIALHPRTKNQISNFGDRELILDNTSNLLLESDIVIGHCSAALDMAIFLKKDLLIVDSNEITPILKIAISCYTNCLDSPSLNISKEETFVNYRKYINKTNYQELINKYFINEDLLKNGKSTIQIILEYISRLETKI